MQLTEQIDLFSTAHASIAKRPMGFSIITLLNSLYGELHVAERRRFMGIAMPSVESENLGDNYWTNTKILEATDKEQFVIVAENAHRREIIVTFWHDRRTRHLSQSATYSYLDFKLVVDEISYFLRHGTQHLDESGKGNNVLPFSRHG